MEMHVELQVHMCVPAVSVSARMSDLQPPIHAEAIALSLSLEPLSINPKWVKSGCANSFRVSVARAGCNASSSLPQCPLARSALVLVGNGKLPNKLLFLDVPWFLLQGCVVPRVLP